MRATMTAAQASQTLHQAVDLTSSVELHDDRCTILTALTAALEQTVGQATATDRLLLITEVNHTLAGEGRLQPGQTLHQWEQTVALGDITDAVRRTAARYDAGGTYTSDALTAAETA